MCMLQASLLVNSTKILAFRANPLSINVAYVRANSVKCNEQNREREKPYTNSVSDELLQSYINMTIASTEHRAYKMRIK